MEGKGAAGEVDAVRFAIRERGVASTIFLRVERLVGFRG